MFQQNFPQKLGTYKVTYKVSDRYSGTSYKTIKIRVTDTLKAPVISGAKNRTVTWGDCDAVGDVTAKQASCDRTKSMQVYIKAPGAAKYKIHTYQEAKKYCFAQEGTYTVKYRAANKNNSAKVSRKIVTITSKKASINKNPVLTVPSKRTVELGAQNAFYGIKASHNGKDVTSRVKVAVQAPNETGYTELTQQAAKTYVFSKAGEYTLRYSVKNQYTPYQTITKFVTVTVFDPNPVIPEDPELPEIPEV